MSRQRSSTTWVSTAAGLEYVLDAGTMDAAAGQFINLMLQNPSAGPNLCVLEEFRFSWRPNSIHSNQQQHAWMTFYVPSVLTDFTADATVTPTNLANPVTPTVFGRKSVTASPPASLQTTAQVESIAVPLGNSFYEARTVIPPGINVAITMELPDPARVSVAMYFREALSVVPNLTVERLEVAQLATATVGWFANFAPPGVDGQAAVPIAFWALLENGRVNGYVINGNLPADAETLPGFTGYTPRSGTA